MSKVVVFDRADGKRAASFGKLAPVLHTQGELEKLVEMPEFDTIVIAPEFSESGKTLVGICVDRLKTTKKIGLLALNTVESPPVDLLVRVFSRIASPATVLSPEQLVEVMAAPNRRDLIIGGTLLPNYDVLLLFRGDLEEIVVPLAWFSPAADGTQPDFKRFRISEYGHGIELGAYDASADVILYEFDPEYRKALNAKRRAEDKSFGACLRRLRIQRGLLQSDFLPHVTEREVGRIERGEIEKPHVKTIRTIAGRLRVKPGEIESW